jgi:ubiquinol-cytochrome c reductase cytochrome c subunit
MKLLRSVGLLKAAPTFVLMLTAASASPIVAQTPPTQASAPTATSGSVEKGRVAFAKVGCAQCHGLEAQGSPTTGPRLGPGALPYAAFSRLVRAPRLQMPPYTEKVLSNVDLADIYAFVQSRPKPTLPSLLQP